MLRLIVCAAALFLFATAVSSASPYDDVPDGHWAYSSLDYLTETGILQGYPDGFFSGDKLLSRYEFAQAVARLIDSSGAEGLPTDVAILADSLRTEFNDQLAVMANSANQLSAQVNGLDTRLGDLSAAVEGNTGRLDAVADTASHYKLPPGWHGLIIYRNHFADQGGDENFIQRTYFYAGYNGKVNDETRVDFMLGTDAPVPNAGFFTMGNGMKSAGLFLERAYVHYTPDWLGYYCTDKSPCNPKLELYAGIVRNQSYDPNEFVWDFVPHYMGVVSKYHFNDDAQLLAAVNMGQEVDGEYFNDDAAMFTAELHHKNVLSPGLDAWLGYYGWNNEEHLPGFYFRDNGYPGLDLNNDGTYAPGTDRFASEYGTVRGGLQYTLPGTAAKGQPFSMFGEYMSNVDSDAEENIAAYNAATGQAVPYSNSDDIGWLAGARYGGFPRAVNDWYVFARYKELGANVVIDQYADLSSRGTNTDNWEVGYGYKWLPNCLFTANYYNNQLHNDFGLAVGDDHREENHLLLDWWFFF